MSTNTPDRLQGIGVKWDRLTSANINAGDSTYTEAGVKVGLPDSGNQTRLDASGTPTGTADLAITCTAAGVPGRAGARYTARRVGSSNAYGYDLPVAQREQAVVNARSGSTLAEGALSILALDDGTILTAEGRSASSTVNTLRVNKRSTAGVWGSTVTAALGTTYGSRLMHPTLVAIPYGTGQRVLCFFMVYDSADDAGQVRAVYSDNGGTGWAVYADYVLNDSIDAATVTIERLSAAYNAGQISLFLGCDDDGDKIVKQYGSADLGASFELVYSGFLTGVAPDVGGRWFDVTRVNGGGFVVAYCATADQDGTGAQLAMASTIGSAFIGINDGNLIGTASGIGMPSSTYPQWPSVCTDDLGTIWRYVIGYDPAGTLDTVGQVVASFDSGVSWSRVGLDAVSGNDGRFYTAPGGEAFPWLGSTTHSRGAVFLAHHGRNAAGGIDYGRSTRVVQLGGFSQVTLPAVDAFVSKTNGLAYSTTWTGLSDVKDSGATISGSASGAFTAAGVWEATASGSFAAAEYTLAMATTAAVGLVARCVVSLSVGTFRASLAVPDYAIRLSFLGTSVTVSDGLANTLGTGTGPAAGELIEIVLAVQNGKGSAAYRLLADGPEAEWYIISDGDTLAADGGVATAFVFGTISGIASTGRWQVYDFATATSDDMATNIAGGLTLRGFPLSTTPRYVLDGISLAAFGGPSAYGDTWTAPIEYTYPIANLDSDSPRDVWRSASAVNGMVVAWDIETLDDGMSAPTGMVFIYLDGINFPSAVFEQTDGAYGGYILETVSADFTAAFAYSRNGSQIRANGTGAFVDGRFVRQNELAGSQFQLDASTVVLIKGNSAGFLTSGAQGDEARAIIEVEGATDAMPFSGTGSIWHKRALVVIRTNFSAIGKLRMVINGVATPPAPVTGDFRIATLAIGDVHAFDQRWGFGRRTLHTYNTRRTRTASGRSSSITDGPPMRSYSARWDDGLITDRLYGDAKGSVLSASSGGARTAMGSTAATLLGLHSMLQDECCLLIPVIDTGTNSVTYVGYDAAECAWGRLGTSIAIENAGYGNELDDEGIRTGLTFEEEA